MKKLTEGMRECLLLLAHVADSLGSQAPKGKEDEYRQGAFWWTLEPSYCWPDRYGFSPGSLSSCVKRNLASEDMRKYRITPSGRAILGEGEEL